MEGLGAPAYKVASFELTDLALIEKVAGTGKPIIMSTGMANAEEISDAVETARGAGASDLILLHCVSAYPAPMEECNLNTIPYLKDTFGTLVGLSDHSLGITAAIAASALDACVIEKHFTLARADGGVDSAFSIEPEELRLLVESTCEAHAALGHVVRGLTPSERDSICFRRSLYVTQHIPKGAPLSRDNIRCIRPGFGLAPKTFPHVLGRFAKRNLERGEPLSWNMIGD